MDSFPTDDFLLRMKIKSKIPRFLPNAWDGNVWLASYEGQEDECWQPGHKERDCNAKPYAPGFIDEQVECRKDYFFKKLLLGVPHGRRGSHHVWWPVREVVVMMRKERQRGKTGLEQRGSHQVRWPVR